MELCVCVCVSLICVGSVHVWTELLSFGWFCSWPYTWIHILTIIPWAMSTPLYWKSLLFHSAKLPLSRWLVIPITQLAPSLLHRWESLDGFSAQHNFKWTMKSITISCQLANNNVPLSPNPNIDEKPNGLHISNWLIRSLSITMYNVHLHSFINLPSSLLLSNQLNAYYFPHMRKRSAKRCPYTLHLCIIFILFRSHHPSPSIVTSRISELESIWRLKWVDANWIWVFCTFLLSLPLSFQSPIPLQFFYFHSWLKLSKLLNN